MIMKREGAEAACWGEFPFCGVFPDIVFFLVLSGAYPCRPGPTNGRRYNAPGFGRRRPDGPGPTNGRHGQGFKLPDGLPF